MNLRADCARTAHRTETQESHVPGWLPAGAKFEERIRSLRNHLGSSQIEFAALLEISSRQVSNWETGDDSPKFATVGKTKSIPAYTKKLVSKLIKTKGMSEKDARAAVDHAFASLRSAQLGKKRKAGAESPELIEARQIILQKEQIIKLQEELIKQLEELVEWQKGQIPEPPSKEEMDERARTTWQEIMKNRDWRLIVEAFQETGESLDSLATSDGIAQVRDKFMASPSRICRLAWHELGGVCIHYEGDLQIIQAGIESALREFQGGPINAVEALAVNGVAFGPQ